MNSPKIPHTDSIEALARFWNTHDLTDVADALAEVTEPVFEHSVVVKIPLQPQEIAAVQEIAKHQGIGSTALIREWILEKIPRS